MSAPGRPPSKERQAALLRAYPFRTPNAGCCLDTVSSRTPRCSREPFLGPTSAACARRELGGGLGERFQASPLALVAFDQLLERRDTIYDNLRDLKFEHRAGKYSEGDYETMKSTLENEAALVLSEIEQVTESQIRRPRPAARPAAADRSAR